MVYGGYGYIDTKYTPGKDEFVTLLWIKGTEPLEKLAEGIASESSVGTWTGIQTMNKFVWDNLRARIFWLHKSDSKSGFVKIAYPLEHFDHDNILQLLASIRGNIFGMKELTELEVLDWSIPAKYQKRFPGPCQGIEGVRKYLGTDKTRRPHVGTIVKPKVGLKPAEFAKVAQNAFMGGLDLVKDDENLVNQEFCRWEDRAVKTIDVAEKAKAETGNSKIYLSNITDFVPNMLKRIDFLNAIGWKMAMIDVYVIGLAGLQHVLTELHKKKFIVHAHRAGYAAETRGKFGVSFMFWEKLYRLLGVDQLHTGTGVGKMEGSPIPIRWLGETLRQDTTGFEPLMLEQKWIDTIKPVMPVASGGLHPGQIEAVVEVYGTTDLTIQAGGGIHGHPGGTLTGARAMRQAADAVADGIPLNTMYKEKEELLGAIELWGITPAEKIKNMFERFEKDKEITRTRLLSSGMAGIEWFNQEFSIKS